MGQNGATNSPAYFEKLKKTRVQPSFVYHFWFP